MINDKLNLDGKQILEKDFKTSMRGYNQEDVDEFLDLIIQDYDVFNQEIERLRQENERLKRTPAREATRSRPVQNETQTPNHQVNYDVLKRLSNLEKAVFGKKYADS
ncbi:DivIVA domain-containing protein [Thalassobacillus cyri]|uniref:DivIVA domain-containing protein n=1 Tax=Thalassobacillus cyri TaxID=571932 RepID=A0A1H4CRK5_9BACI|nr:cell division regulator GpsB [Thalassobacillus cyri]SEA63023.1 DivIVA domain-containing protein [Thalassobacillus cyri]